jgi:hypothetical protein
MSLLAKVLGISLFAIASSAPVLAQAGRFAGAGPGIAILSAGSEAVIDSSTASLSNYKPARGALVHVFAGIHLSDYWSLQATWSANRNELTMSSSLAAAGFYQQRRSSSQQNLGGDLLLYFRNRRSFVRPFLSVGLNSMWFSSEPIETVAASGSLSPPASFKEQAPGLRVAAGADLMLPSGWGFRYAFLENMQRNVIGASLSPPANPVLMNFQHIFGFVKYF